MHLLVIRCKY